VLPFSSTFVPSIISQYQLRATAQLTADYCRVYVSVVGVSPNLEFMLMVLAPSPNRIVADWFLPATFDGAVKVSDRLFPVSRQVPEPFTVLPENVAVNVPFGLNSITSLPLQEVVEPPGNGIVAGHSNDWLPVAIDVWRHRPTNEDESAGKLPAPLVLQPNRNISSTKPPIEFLPKLSLIVCFPFAPV
jgi:hypothetical protein